MALLKASEPAGSLREAPAVPARRFYGSFKTRLRLSVILLVTLLVLALSIADLEEIARVNFDEVHDRASLVAEDAKNLIIHRVTELAAARPASPGGREDTKRVWAEIIRTDPTISTMIEKSMAASKVVVEIRVVDQSNTILASSSANRGGAAGQVLPLLPRWSEVGFMDQLRLMFQRQDYVYPIRLGAQAPDSETLFTIEAIVSSVLMWERLKPQIRHLVEFNLLALGLSILAAMLFSDVAIGPLKRISSDVDRIARGEMPAQEREFGSTELDDVHSKLNVLGQEFRGARKDAVELRANIERMLDRLEDAVLLFDADHRLVTASRAAERLLGDDVRNLAGQTLEELFPSSTGAGEVIKSSLDSGKTVRDRLVAVKPAKTAGGAEVWVDLAVEILHLGEGRAGTLITMRDAETRTQIETQLDVSARLSAISRLTSGVAHEIKNPLNAMTLHLEVLRSRLDESDAEGRATLAVIQREVSRLDRVVKTFLDFTRPVEPRMRPVDIVALLRQSTDLLLPQAQRRGCEIQFVAEPAKIHLRGDPDMLKQAVLNILVNGLEAMEPGGRLDVRVIQKADDCVITISDQGPGIDPDIRDKVFNLYFTTKGSGSGIGLAVAFQVVQLHNGTIDFTSYPGQGTTFRLLFPVYERGRDTH